MGNVKHPERPSSPVRSAAGKSSDQPDGMGIMFVCSGGHFFTLDDLGLWGFSAVPSGWWGSQYSWKTCAHLHHLTLACESPRNGRLHRSFRLSPCGCALPAFPKATRLEHTERREMVAKSRRERCTVLSAESSLRTLVDFWYGTSDTTVLHGTQLRMVVQFAANAIRSNTLQK
jgi:hypothetical protein